MVQKGQKTQNISQESEEISSVTTNVNPFLPQIPHQRHLSVAKNTTFSPSVSSSPSPSSSKRSKFSFLKKSDTTSTSQSSPAVTEKSLQKSSQIAPIVEKKADPVSIKTDVKQNETLVVTTTLPNEITKNVVAPRFKEETNVESKANTRSNQEIMEKRLTTIETKVDQIITILEKKTGGN